MNVPSIKWDRIIKRVGDIGNKVYDISIFDANSTQVSKLAIFKDLV